MSIFSEEKTCNFQEEETYYYPCPCGDRFAITKEELECGEEVATCPSCSLIIKVILVVMVILIFMYTLGFMVISLSSCSLVIKVILVILVIIHGHPDHPGRPAHSISRSSWSSLFIAIMVFKLNLTSNLIFYLKVIYDIEDFQDEEEAPSSVATKLEALKL